MYLLGLFDSRSESLFVTRSLLHAALSLITLYLSSKLLRSFRSDVVSFKVVGTAGLIKRSGVPFDDAVSSLPPPPFKAIKSLLVDFNVDLGSFFVFFLLKNIFYYEI